ncbi:hypothetical protein GCM10008090_30430 [Arenicella chitinivorans]|uniref:Uncharacterized protein n=1 Tax=Arenicella chitinivorans TaxID=1329800 RepID=A0A918S119_9GAMM|nr:hypothetical protein [Arenicella chitinivorans]GHA18736.1 hypothetical protein GCM10008090_30430 [Arenicella chitinivorans]
MPDCSGYGFGLEINMCVDGEVGAGNYAQVTFSINETLNTNFHTDSITRSWDGSRTVFDVTSEMSSYGGYGSANCTTKAARITIIPDANTNTGTLLIEFELDGCGAAPSSYSPQVVENCGGIGPYIISEMTTYTLDQPACVV